MATNSYSNEGNHRSTSQQTYSSVMKEVGQSTRDLIQSEINLIMAEFKQVTHNLGKHTTQAVVYSSLLFLSVIPFLAFLVIGLGEYLDGRYWLSSLIVSIACALVGGPMAMRAFKKIKTDDLKMPHVRSSLEKEVETVQRKFQDLKTTATVQGEHHESH